MIQKLTALALSLFLTLSLAACGSSGAGSSADAGAGSSGSISASGSVSSQETDPAGSTADPDGSAQPGEDAAESQESETPATETVSPSKPSAENSSPAKPNTSKPSGSTPSKPSSGSSTPSNPGSGTPANSVDLSAFYTSVVQSDPDFPANTQITGEMMDSLYAGLSALSTKQCVIYLPMISASACEIALVEVSSSSDVQSVKDIFQARIDYQVQQGAWYPATVEAWQNNAKIVTNGNYVMLICYDDTDSIVKSFNALFS